MGEVAYTIGLLLSNRSDLRLLDEFLKASGHSVVTGPFSEEDLQPWRDVSLVIADERLARHYGKALLSLKWNVGPSFIPLLIALPAATDSAAWLRAGFDDVLRLPVTRTELLARLSVFFRLREKSEQQYRAFFENALIGIYRMTPDGRFVMANPALVSMLDYGSYEEMVAAYQNADDSDCYLHNIYRHCIERGDTAIGIESSWTKADGETIYFREHVTCVRDDAGEIVCYEGTVEDITERKQYEQALQEAKHAAESANRAKTTFLANMSHEIRTPLTGIIGFTSFLARQVEEPQRRYIHLIERSGKRLMETLEAVLTLAKLEADRVEMVFDILNLANEAEEVVQLFRQQAAQKDIQLQMQLKPGPPPLARLDRGALGSITQNLVSNAIKFTSHGSVNVTVYSDEYEVHIEVRDTGIGIDSKFMVDLFEPFRQESTGLDRSHEGIGLGLSIARQLVEKMGGRITAESESGAGSTFTVSFPRARPETSPSSAAETRPSPVRTTIEGQQPRVLLVEDNEDTRILMETLLGDVCQVTLAANAEQAISGAREREHDLVLMDINLGNGPDGQAVLQTLRRMPGYAHIPVVALTAYALPGDREAFLSAGFSDYLSKPFTAEELLGLISDLP